MCIRDRLSADRLADLNIVVALTCAPFFLAPGASGVPARFLGRVNSMSPAVFWMGFCMLLLAALHAYVRFYVQTPAIDHLAFFAAQYALTAAAHYWKLAEGEVVGAGALVWLMPMALASAYFAFA